MRVPTAAKIVYHLATSGGWKTREEIQEAIGTSEKPNTDLMLSLMGEDMLKRRKRDQDGVGKNPYEYKIAT